MAGLAPLDRRDARRRTRLDRGRGRRPPSQRPDRRRDRLRDRGHRAVRRRDGEPVRLDGHVPPGRLRVQRRRGEAVDGSAPSGSSTRARRASRRPSSRGPPERLIASAHEPLRALAARARLRRRAHATGARRTALRSRRARLVVDGRADAGNGRWAVDGARDTRLVRRRVGGDDGGDDVSVGGADRRALLAHDEEPLAVAPLAFASGYLVAWASIGVLRLRGRSRRRTHLGRRARWDRAGRWVAGATLLVAAVYELTPLKDVCLEVPKPARLPARLLARRRVGRAEDGPGTALGASDAAGP